MSLGSSLTKKIKQKMTAAHCNLSDRALSTVVPLSLWPPPRCAAPWMRAMGRAVKVRNPGRLWQKSIIIVLSSSSSECVIPHLFPSSWADGGLSSSSCFHIRAVQSGTNDWWWELCRGPRVYGEIHRPRVRSEDHQQEQMQGEGETTLIYP